MPEFSIAGSVLVTVGGFALNRFGVSVLAIGSALVAFTPIPFILLSGRERVADVNAASG